MWKTTSAVGSGPVEKFMANLKVESSGGSDWTFHLPRALSLDFTGEDEKISRFQRLGYFRPVGRNLQKGISVGSFAKCQEIHF